MKVVRQEQWTALGLGGRQSWEVLSGRQGARAATLRYVVIPPEAPGAAPRPRHRHREVEEVYWVMEGTGRIEGPDGSFAVGPGDVAHIAPGEPHVTRNLGPEPLRLLCFFPAADIGPLTDEPAP